MSGEWQKGIKKVYYWKERKKRKKEEGCKERKEKRRRKHSWGGKKDKKESKNTYLFPPSSAGLSPAMVGVWLFGLVCFSFFLLANPTTNIKVADFLIAVYLWFFDKKNLRENSQCSRLA